MKNQANGHDHEWVEPEGILLFGPVESGNNEWGCDDFYPIDML
eukprot:CAMPEP_0170125624 /NCGR_PEP_ID=MMETSP0020_2-20130122/19138_1 /TAXON_ID=98059 /ORGANISM="Dinobryon sp., Strain UTEXLB2267" /LENGTH=42 /DNA_ID= /DNA_START= /DNA_END= /DNA_ORIENTATION=